MFLADLFRKLQPAGAQPAVQLRESQQWQFWMCKAAFLPRGTPCSCTALSCVLTRCARSEMCHSGIHPWPLLPCPARFHMLLGQQRASHPALCSSSLQQGQLHLAPSQPFCLSQSATGCQKHRPVRGWSLAGGLEKEASRAGGWML